jgi:SAM-dependent methyltransferase
MSLVDTVHGAYVHSRRTRLLCEHLASLMPHKARVLDVGCGDGLLARCLLQSRVDLEIHGLDVLVRPKTHIPVKLFDGRVIPHRDASFDVVLFMDVLHHVDEPMGLLAEAVRVSRQHLVIKDHTKSGLLAGPTLRFMDWVGNARHGVVLPYNYWPKERWKEAFEELQLQIGFWKRDLGLYPPPASWLFGRSLHFLARLDLHGGSGCLAGLKPKP